MLSEDGTQGKGAMDSDLESTDLHTSKELADVVGVTSGGGVKWGIVPRDEGLACRDDQ